MLGIPALLDFKDWIFHWKHSWVLLLVTIFTTLSGKQSNPSTKQTAELHNHVVTWHSSQVISSQFSDVMAYRGLGWYHCSRGICCLKTLVPHTRTHSLRNTQEYQKKQCTGCQHILHMMWQKIEWMWDYWYVKW